MKSRRDIIDISSSDEEMPTKKKSKLIEILDEVRSLRKDVNHVMKLTKGMTLPPGLYKQLDETFKCHICHLSPFNPPAIFGRCCRNIIGCSACVDRWFKEESLCPLCRSDRALPDTCIINGLDDFILSINPLLNAADPSKVSSNATSSGGRSLALTPPRQNASFVNSDSDFA